jgi:hypothetical protein
MRHTEEVKLNLLGSGKDAIEKEGEGGLDFSDGVFVATCEMRYRCHVFYIRSGRVPIDSGDHAKARLPRSEQPSGWDTSSPPWASLVSGMYAFSLASCTYS